MNAVLLLVVGFIYCSDWLHCVSAAGVTRLSFRFENFGVWCLSKESLSFQKKISLESCLGNSVKCRLFGVVLVSIFLEVRRSKCCFIAEMICQTWLLTAAIFCQIFENIFVVQNVVQLMKWSIKLGFWLPQFSVKFPGDISFFKCCSIDEMICQARLLTAANFCQIS